MIHLVYAVGNISSLLGGLLNIFKLLYVLLAAVIFAFLCAQTAPHMHSPDENQFPCARQSLWSLITKYVSESELLKIHAALGDPLVDMYTEVHSEVSYEGSMFIV